MKEQTPLLQKQTAFKTPFQHIFFYQHSLNPNNHSKQSNIKMQIIIVTNSNHFPLEITQQEPVLEIKQKIAVNLGIPTPLQTLSILGFELIDGLDMDDYPIIHDGTNIDLTLNNNFNPEHDLLLPCRIPITIKFSSKQINIEVDNISETVRSLKEKIHIIDATPIKRMLLYTSGVEMEEEYRYLSEYGVTEYSEITVFLKSMNRIKAEPPCRKVSMVVQTSKTLLNAATIPLEMKDTSTVNEVRQLLLSRKILPMDDYIFIHKQRIMRDNCTLRWHGVDNGDYLYVFKGTISKE
ncbi:uncharacterized protein [Spinacia oleracea]|uniref:Ubiquitin-like domain-containing protein n=1 Tax=Spinacia oleracea TaxID=3562 RepID=A0A9R0JG42_SPIOL|nr:uncharacterized protein LOC110805916 [Spinacia oleracea]